MSKEKFIEQNHDISSNKFEYNERFNKLGGFSLPSELHPSRNEDACVVDIENMAIGVFDGVGGDPGSEKASQLASRVFLQYLRYGNFSDTIELMHSAIMDSHYTLIEDHHSEIATTATLAKAYEDIDGITHVGIASVGDSRAYLFKDNQLSHLTLDQGPFFKSVFTNEETRSIQEKLASITSKDDLIRHDKKTQVAFYERNVLSGYLGDLNNTPNIQIVDIVVNTGDKIIITSDGIHDNLTDKEILKIVSKPKDIASMTAENLVKAAQDRSKEIDNIRSKPDDMTAAILII